ncbi:helix-turn-helix transcriptional regulator [Duganella sp. sic0402]|uniref:AraC family transcriptional regulator n=1 Tax=Duganella sp. sic0402 TaxID=2854786 RepID=UPI001C44B9A3|nr:helix-turn-helix transcriptional regulator [Duganella sp. sic0402]MBV7534986.1 helix-turn-helix transcriptional regulator [Duganella sp. sic0402]
MPVLKEFPRLDLPLPADWIDPDTVPRPVVTVGINAEKTGSLEIEPHSHIKAQFFLCLRGVLTCESAGGFWLVPPQSALWIPADTEHALKMEGVVEGYTAFIDADALPMLPETCSAYSASQLMRELMRRSASFPALYPEGGFESRLIALLLEEIQRTPRADLHLPIPSDKRARRIVDMMLANPGQRGTITSWAKLAGLSERTLSRLIAEQTGMSFGRWRQQITIILAVQRLGAGASIQQVAAELGYESASSFVTMFRKAVGVPPGRYMHGRSVD